MKAFPRTTKMWKNSNEDSYEIASDEGMDLRDYFAAKAMQGFASTLTGVDFEPKWSVLATDSYKMADAMMKAREQ
jgi:hypothetical protein